MTSPGPTTHATVGHGAKVGIVASEVHNSTVYQVNSGATPDEKYTVGLQYLEDGIPSRARELIEEVRGHGLSGGEVQFHWVLAMLSKRSYRDLTTEERHQLEGLPTICATLPHDAWSRGLNALCELLDYLAAPDSDAQPAIKALTNLDPPQRRKILRHLDLVLTGGLRDSFWAEARRHAEATQLSNDREKRVWAYFHPLPARPRARRPAPSTTTPRDRARAAIGTLVGVLAVGYLGRTVLLNAQVLPIIAYLGALGATIVAARNGYEWRYRSARLAAKNLLYRTRSGRGLGAEDGFSRSVDNAFEYYFAKYAPRGETRQACLAATAGFKTALRKEITEIYRESRIPVNRIRWLIGYEVSKVVRRWKNGDLFAYRFRYRVDSMTKIRCVVATAVLIATSGYTISSTIDNSLIPTVAATIAAIAGATAAGAGWSRIASERRRIAEEQLERDEVLAAREAEYTRWKNRLDSTRPSETEMEQWLNADKIKFLDKALKHYRLAWRDILTHAFLQTPTEDSKRARVKGAPWRYSKYAIRLFLITHDGVRELTTEIDFEDARLHGEERNNFRFDAVSSVHVATSSELSYSMELVLMNGEPQNIDITDYRSGELAPNETPLALTKMSLDAAGFTNTLHILEGIAAEGKNWIKRDPYINTAPRGGISESDLH